jgi:hypothetical protein
MPVAGIMVAAIRAMGITPTNIMSGATGKIMPHIVAQIDTMLTAQAHQGEHKLAYEYGASDHRADQEKRCHGRPSATFEKMSTLPVFRPPPPILAAKASSDTQCPKSNSLDS